MSKVISSSTFLNNFGITNERVKILHWLDRHGGSMVLRDVINASPENPEIVIHRVAGFMNDGFVRCNPALTLEQLPEADQATTIDPCLVELTDQGRALLKYA